MTSVRIEPLPGTAIAEDKDIAKQIRESTLMPELEKGRTVTLDFGGVEIATQSFIHALVSEPVRRFGEAALKQIDFKNCSDEVKQLVLTVVEYTLMAIDSTEDAPEPRGSESA